MANVWLPKAKKFDLSASKGYGPFGATMFRGVIPHVNAVNGDTPDSFYQNNPEVCPNLQVDRDGDIHQYLPLNWQPWCQGSGNQMYAAVECGGLPSVGYTKEQVAALAYILGAYHTYMGLVLRPIDVPGEYGIGTHRMGGAAYGGHSCPGDIRAAQRTTLIAAVNGSLSVPVKPTPEGTDRLTTNHYLLPGKTIYSKNGHYRLILQGDGNLVLYSTTKPVWATYSHTGTKLAMQSDGNLVLYDRTNRAIWTPMIQNKGGNRLVVQDDGNLVVYSATKPIWDIRDGNL